MLNKSISAELSEEAAELIPAPVKQVIEQIVSAVISFVLAQTGVFGNYAPFGMAYVAVVPQHLSVFTTLGAMAGYIAGQHGASSLRYIGAMVGITLLRRVFDGYKTGFSRDAVCAAIALICSLATGVAAAIGNASGFTDFLMYISEAVLAGGAAFFFSRISEISEAPRGLTTLNSQETACFVIVGCIFFMSVSSFSVFGISPGRILMALAVLIAARFGGEAAGSIAGISVGVTMRLIGDPTMMAESYALGGLLAGAFSRLGSVGCAAAFLVSNAVGLVLAQGSSASIFGLYESIIAAALFVFIPARYVRRLEGMFSRHAELHSGGGMKGSVVNRLTFAANAMNDVAQSVEAVSVKLKKIGANDFDGVYRQVQDGVCQKCGLKMYCWEKNFNGTCGVFNDISFVLRKKERIEAEDVPEYFRERCIRIQPLLNAFNVSYADFILRESAEARIAEVRSVVADQFDGMADMLSDLSNELNADEKYDAKAAARVTCVLQAFGLEPVGVACRLDKYERMTIEATCLAASHRLDVTELRGVLDEACDRFFDTPCLCAAGEETKITVSERATLKLQRGIYQAACNNGTICGDAYECFNDGRGREVSIISDGMGSGGRAAVDGAMAAGLIGRLCRAGFGFDCSLRVVNSALLVKSGDESLATLDIACTDLFTGRTDFYKAGACASFVRKNGKAHCVEQSSLPAGILRQVEFGRVSVNLSEDDIILLVSDGVINGSSEWIKAELESWKNGTPESLAEHIASEARRRRLDGHEDDITVIASVLKKGV